MELSEVARRIFGQHWRLIIFCVFFVLAGIAFASLARGGSDTYTASTRLVLDTQDPKTRSESTSISDTAKAIATSPSQVRTALKDAHVTNRDPLDVARNHVSTRALGTSAVVQLSVSDRNRRVAAAVANALAARVIRARLEVSGGQLKQVLSNLGQQIDDLTTRIAHVDAQIDKLNVGLANALGAHAANALRSRRDAATRSRDFLAQQRGVLESERVSLLSTDALRPKPSIISPAAVPESADASPWLSYLLLGTLLGLILGVGCAGLMEVIRPTLVGGDVLARELGTPLLGTLPNEPDGPASSGLPVVSARLWLAAEAAGVETVALASAAPDVDLAEFAEQLEATPPHLLDPHPAARAAERARSGLRIRPFALDDTSPTRPGRVGLVLVAPAKLRKAKLVEVNELLRMTSLPLLGLIVSASSPPASRQAPGPKMDAVAGSVWLLLLVPVAMLVLYVTAH
jgi:capsular polysaccharide biosynthesis protein